MNFACLDFEEANHSEGAIRVLAAIIQERGVKWVLRFVNFN